MKIQIKHITFIMLFAGILFIACSGDGSGESDDAASGTLDTSFNGCGYYVYISPDEGSEGYDIAFDDNDDIFIAGRVDYTKDDMALWKLTSDGELDATFAGTGFVTHNNAAGNNGDDYGYSICISNDGLIYVAGRSAASSYTDTDIAVWSLTSEGFFNTEFSNDGIVTHDGGAGVSEGTDSTLDCIFDNMGRLILAGYSINTSGYIDLTIWRYNENGSLDTSLGASGYIADDLDSATTNQYGHCVTLDSYGNIIVAGQTDYSPYNMFVAKYYNNGNRIPDFGTDGYIIEGTGVTTLDTVANDVVVDSQNSIFVTGTFDNIVFFPNLAIWKYLEDGTPDTEFGTNGVASYVNDEKKINGSSICLDSQERIIVAGYITNSNADLAVWRFNSDGTPDTSFGTDGIFVHSSAAGGEKSDGGRSVAIDSSGRIVVTGFSYDEDDVCRMTVWRIVP